MDYGIYLDKIVEIKVAVFGGGSRTAIGRITGFTQEDIILCKDYQYGRQCIDFKDVLDIKLVEVTPDDIYNALMTKEQ